MWRAPEEGRVLLMAGYTTHYAVEPRGEYVFGVVTGRAMRSRRGRERRLIQPGQLVAWDPSQAHAGTAVESQPWTSRLIVVETADLAALAGDQETALPADIAFPEPALTDPELVRGFVQMHMAFEGATNPTSASTSSPLPPVSESSASSVCSVSARAFHRTRCRSPTVSARPADCSRPAGRSPAPPPPLVSPTRATCTATSSAASA